MRKLISMFFIITISLFLITLSSCTNEEINNDTSSYGKVMLENDGIYNGGSITLSESGLVVAGKTIIVRYEANDGYELDTIFLNNEPINGLSFVVVPGNNIVKATFNLVPDTPDYGNVILDNNGIFEGGHIELSQVGSVEVGTIVNITVTPDEGFILEEITLNGEILETNSFNVLFGDNHISAKFKIPEEPPVEIKSGNVSLIDDGSYLGGSLSLSAFGLVDLETEIVIEVEAEDGYELDTIYLNDVALEGRSFIVLEEINYNVKATFKLIQDEPLVKELRLNAYNFNTIDFIDYNNVIHNASYPNEFTIGKNGGSISSSKITNIVQIEVVLYSKYSSIIVYDNIEGEDIVSYSIVSDREDYSSGKSYIFEMGGVDDFLITNTTTHDIYFFELNITYLGEIDSDKPFIEEDGIIDISKYTFEKHSKLVSENIETLNERLVFLPGAYIESVDLSSMLFTISIFKGNPNLSVYGIKGEDKTLLDGVEEGDYIFYLPIETYDKFMIKNETDKNLSALEINVLYAKPEEEKEIKDVSISEAIKIASGLSRNKGTTEDFYRITGVVTQNTGSQVTISDGDVSIVAYSATPKDNMNLGYTLTLVGKLQNYYSKPEIVEYVVEEYQEIYYNLTLNPTTNGTYEVSKLANLSFGEVITITATPDQDYVAYNAVVDGRPLKFSNSNTVKFSINGNMTISVIFKLASEIEEIVTIGEDYFSIYSLEMSGTYGDCNLVSYGNYDILFDGGTADDSQNIKVLLEEYVTDGILDLIIISHPDSDHYAGLTNGGLQGVNEVKRLITNTEKHNNSNIINAVKSKSPDVICDVASLLTSEENKVYRVEVDSYFYIDIMYSSGYTGNGANNASIPVIVNYKETKLFMGGDMEESACTAFIQMYPGLFSADDFVIFKILHHGSNGSNKTNFLSYLMPDVAFVSAPLKTSSNKPNFNTHPYLEAMKRVGQFTTDVYWAGLTGTFEMKCDGSNVLVSGTGRTRDYQYKDSSGSYVNASRVDEIDIKYFNSCWYLEAVNTQGAPDYAGILN